MEPEKAMDEMPSLDQTMVEILADKVIEVFRSKHKKNKGFTLLMAINEMQKNGEFSQDTARKITGYFVRRGDIVRPRFGKF